MVDTPYGDCFAVLTKWVFEPLPAAADWGQLAPPLGPPPPEGDPSGGEGTPTARPGPAAAGGPRAARAPTGGGGAETAARIIKGHETEEG